MPRRRRRNPAGMGSVYRITDARNGHVAYRAALTTILDDGTHGRVYFRGQTEREALAAMHAYRERGPEPVTATTSLGEYLDEWLRGVTPTIEGATARSYRQRLAPVTRLLGPLPLGELTPGHCQQLTTDLLATYAPGTVKAIRSVLHMALEQARRWRLIPFNPLDDTRAPRQPSREVHTLSVSQAQQFLDAATDDPLLPMWALMVSTGMRLGEVIGLRWSAVDLEQRRVTVATQVQRNPETRAFEERVTKGKRTRVLPLSSRAHAELSRLAFAEVGPKDYVFPGPRGGPWHSTTLRARFVKALTRAGLPAIHPHDLRHTAATLLLAEGVHPKLVQALLGHRTIAMTMDVYTHVDQGMMGAVAAAMDRLLPPGTADDATALPHGADAAD